MIFDERYTNMDARTRRENSIFPCLVTKKTGSKVTLDTGFGTMDANLPFGADEICEGDYLDIQLFVTTYDNGKGKVTKILNRANLIATTPTEFCPIKE